MKRAPAAIAALALWGIAGSAGAEPARVLVAVGDNLGDPDDPPLRHAEEDAARVAALFTEIGDVRSDRAYVVTNEGADGVRRRLTEVTGRVAELQTAGTDVALFVYVSAHASGGVLHLSGSHLPLDDLVAFARDSGARLRVVVVDACDSGAIARQKGGRPVPAYEVSLQGTKISGQVLITSSGPAEASQEWDSLGGSLFTHHWLTGLRGDADVNGDGQVTLAEAYAYAYQRTVVEGVGASQHPGFDVDLSGTGELVLTRPASARSALLFGAALQGNYVLSSQPGGSIVAEFVKQAGHALRLAVPAGRYVLRKRLGLSVGLLTLDLPFGGELRVDESKLVRRDYREVVLKGGYVELHPSSVMASAALESSALSGVGPEWRLGLRYRYDAGQLWAALSVAAGAATFHSDDLQASQVSATLGLSGGWRFFLGPVEPYAGPLLRLRLLRQTFQRDQEAQIDQVLGVSPLPARLAAGLDLGLVGGAVLPFSRLFFGFAEVDLLGRFLPADGQAVWSPGLEGNLGLGVKL